MLLLFVVLVRGVPAAPVAHTRLGAVVGSYDSGGDVARFVGVPYAVPPLGRLRFAASQLANTPYDGPLMATSFGSPCIQSPAGDPNEVPEPEAPPPDENCLFLNIWTSSPLNGTRASDHLTPVMVWVHGGGYCSGAGSCRWQYGTQLASKGVVVVTLNYRLGPLGFLVSDDDAAIGNGGLNGVYDVITALRWIRSNIDSFGGDPESVTLFGQSSGSSAICELVVSPLAAGLFHRAIMQSGSCIGGWGPHNATYGRQLARQVMSAVNASNILDLRKVPAALVQWPDDVMTNVSLAPYFSAHFFDEGGVLPDFPATLYEQGAIQIAPQDIIIGFTSKDGTAAFYGTSPTKDAPTSAYEPAMRQVWGGRAEKILQAYPLDQYLNNSAAAFIQADADAYVICPSLSVAASLSRSSVGPFVFQHAHFRSQGCDTGVTLDVIPTQLTPVTRAWATHGSDISFMFGTEVGPNPITYKRAVCPFSQDEWALSNEMMSRIAQFATTGDPNPPGFTTIWPRHCATTPCSPRAVLRFGVDPTDGSGITILENFSRPCQAFGQQ